MERVCGGRGGDVELGHGGRIAVNLEQWAAEVRRLHAAIGGLGTRQTISVEQSAVQVGPEGSPEVPRWKASIGGFPSTNGRPTSEAVMQELLRELRRALKQKIESQRKILAELLTLENEAAIKLLDEEK